MEEVKPFRTVNDAISNLDNGGRFYDLVSKADDGKITHAEICKTGGIFNDKQKMVLFFELSIAELSQKEKEAIISKFDGRLKKDYEKYKPQHLLPSEVDQKGVLSSNIILNGVPTLIDSQTKFNGFILIPIMAGKSTSFTLVPLIDCYDIYELKDDRYAEEFLIAHVRDSKKLPNKEITVAGVLKELETKKNGRGPKKKFLETVYHLP